MKKKILNRFLTRQPLQSKYGHFCVEAMERKNDAVYDQTSVLSPFEKLYDLLPLATAECLPHSTNSVKERATKQSQHSERKHIERHEKSEEIARPDILNTDAL